MISLNINNGGKEDLLLSEGKQSGLACIQVNGEVFSLNAAQAASVVNFLTLLIEAKEQDENGKYKWLKDNAS